jgi:hypothetical protein
LPGRKVLRHDRIQMNPKRLIIAIIVVFAGVFATDFLIHGFWLQSAYKQTAELWRTDAEMQAHMSWLLTAQFLFSAIFVLLYAKGFAAAACPGCALAYGTMMGLFFQANTLVAYAVQPLPAAIAVKWFVSGVLQGTLMGLLAYLVYKPKAGATPAVDSHSAGLAG